MEPQLYVPFSAWYCWLGACKKTYAAISKGSFLEQMEDI